MVLNQVLFGLRTGRLSPERARQLGRMAYIEWLSRLPGGSDYAAEARRAYRHALPQSDSHSAAAEFCVLLLDSLRVPPQPLDLDLPPPSRRGGAAARRGLLRG